MIEIEKVDSLGDDYVTYMVKTDHPFDLVEFSQELGIDPSPFDVRTQTLALMGHYVTLAVVRKELVRDS